MPRRLDFIQRQNAAYIEEQYARYLRDPNSVAEEWALFFAGFDLAADQGEGAAATTISDRHTTGVPAPAVPVHGTAAHTSGVGHGAAGVFGLVHAYREFGHLVAQLDPLGRGPEIHPLL